MKRTAWIDRKFAFNAPPGWIYNVISRLAGTSSRLKALVYGLTEAQLSQSLNNTWSIKQHIGHLIELERLHLHRLNQLKDKSEYLTGADMSNQATEKGDYNNLELEELLPKFQVIRKEFISGLQSLSEEQAHHKALHPRLVIFMRPIDLAEFCAEHDDHHLASIMEIRNELSGRQAVDSP